MGTLWVTEEALGCVRSLVLITFSSLQVSMLVSKWAFPGQAK